MKNEDKGREREPGAMKQEESKLVALRPVVTAGGLLARTEISSKSQP